MNHIKNLLETKYYRRIFIVFLIICIGIGAFCFQYYFKLQDTVHAESKGYLKEVSTRIGSNINRIINDNYALLETLGAALKQVDANNFDDVRNVAKEQQQYWNYKDMILLSQSGKGYNLQGDEVSIANNEFIFDVDASKTTRISTTQIIDEEECIMLAVPVKGLKLNGEKMVALGAIYDPVSFDKVLSMSAFDGKAYSCIISKEGTTIVRSSAQTTMKTGYNVLSTIEKARLDDNASMDTIRKEIKGNIGGQIGFTQDGIRYYMVYTPVEPEAWYLLTFVPTSVVNEKSDLLLRTTLFLCGLIVVSFAGLIIVILLTFYYNRRKLETIAYVDELTGGNTIQKFYELAEGAVRGGSDVKYALIYTNMRQFKLVNEQFGQEIGDEIIKTFYDTICKTLASHEYIGRLGADNFCVLVEDKGREWIIGRLQKWYADAEDYIQIAKPIWNLPATEFGVFIIEEPNLSFPLMIDRAKIAIRFSQQSIGARGYYGIYDEKARQILMKEKELEDMMETALVNGEFQVYLQPKYNVATQEIGGAEALVRWQSQEKGMIFPDEFIPLFERNGFIIDVDLYVFEEVCRYLRVWLDSGLTPMKISINCSRIHLRDEHFLEAYHEVVTRYAIPPGLIEIELTESVVMEDMQRLTKVINDMHDIGFECSLDDFGSGYSSLNLIVAIPVDTLKLDRIFFVERSEADRDRMEVVLKNVIKIAKSLSMETVAEGVELHEQVKMLEGMKCDYIQGYVFARPMPIQEFEKLAFGL